MRNPIIPLFLLAVALMVGCTKEKEPGPVQTVEEKKPTVDEIVGSYTGTQKTIRHTYVPYPGPGWVQDTVNQNDTFVITKQSADSFVLARSSWSVKGKLLEFKFDPSNAYVQHYEYKRDSVNLQFNPTDGTVFIKRYTGPGHSYQVTIQWDSFSGKK